jgi:predicted metal-binding protein
VGDFEMEVYTGLIHIFIGEKLARVSLRHHILFICAECRGKFQNIERDPRIGAQRRHWLVETIENVPMVQKCPKVP